MAYSNRAEDWKTRYSLLSDKYVDLFDLHKRSCTVSEEDEKAYSPSAVGGMIVDANADSANGPDSNGSKRASARSTSGAGNPLAPSTIAAQVRRRRADSVADDGFARRHGASVSSRVGPPLVEQSADAESEGAGSKGGAETKRPNPADSAILESAPTATDNGESDPEDCERGDDELPPVPLTIAMKKRGHDDLGSRVSMV